MGRERKRTIRKEQEKINLMKWDGMEILNIEVDLRMAVIWYFLTKKLQT